RLGGEATEQRRGRLGAAGRDDEVAVAVELLEMSAVGVGEGQAVDDDSRRLVAGGDVQVPAAGVDRYAQHRGGPGAGQPRVDEPGLGYPAARWHTPDDRLAAGVADVEISAGVEHDEGRHVGEGGVR